MLAALIPGPGSIAWLLIDRGTGRSQGCGGS
jgi:hypothetical protein